MSYHDYIGTYLVPQILAKFPEEILDSVDFTRSTGLDGFMSAIFNIRIKTKTAKGEMNDRQFIAKLMKIDNEFRESSKSYLQFENEIFIYSKVLPVFNKMLTDCEAKTPNLSDMIPKSYVARFGYIEGLSTLSTDYDSILVLEHLGVAGYKLGPRVYLNRSHLLKMSALIGQFHALSYSLKWRQMTEWKNLVEGIKPLPFINKSDPNDKENNFYRILYRVAFDRFFEYFDRLLEERHFDHMEHGAKIVDRLKNLRSKYFCEPTELLERYRTQIMDFEVDKRFGVILHGDYNRNNVLFCYNKPKGSGDAADSDNEVVDIKMIDFQETRFGSPALDLSFFMYFNTSDDMREDIWMDILKVYHNNVMEPFSRIYKSNAKTAEDIKRCDEILANYNFENFISHFSRFAFYGVMICMHFLPWVLSTEEECAALAKEFECDMHGEKFRKLSLEIGGDEVNARILNVVKHACKMGYMDCI